MKTVEYQELLAQIAPLDTSTLTRLETDLARLLKQRQAGKSAERRPLKELLALAQKNLEGRDESTYWAEREKDIEDSRTSWVEREKEIDRERRS